jgi:hypothetical protein
MVSAGHGREYGVDAAVILNKINQYKTMTIAD